MTHTAPHALENFQTRLEVLQDEELRRLAAEIEALDRDSERLDRCLTLELGRDDWEPGRVESIMRRHEDLRAVSRMRRGSVHALRAPALWRRALSAARASPVDQPSPAPIPLDDDAWNDLWRCAWTTLRANPAAGTLH